MRITIETRGDEAEPGGLVDQFARALARAMRPYFHVLRKDIEEMSSTLSDQLTAAQAQAEAALADITTRVDALAAAAPGQTVSQAQVDAANRIAAVATAIQTKLAAAPVAPPAA